MDGYALSGGREGTRKVVLRHKSNYWILDKSYPTVYFPSLLYGSGRRTDFKMGARARIALWEAFG